MTDLEGKDFDRVVGSALQDPAEFRRCVELLEAAVEQDAAAAKADAAAAELLALEGVGGDGSSQARSRKRRPKATAERGGCPSEG